MLGGSLLLACSGLTLRMVLLLPVGISRISIVIFLLLTDTMLAAFHKCLVCSLQFPDGNTAHLA